MSDKQTNVDLSIAFKVALLRAGLKTAHFTTVHGISNVWLWKIVQGITLKSHEVRTDIDHFCRKMAPVDYAYCHLIAGQQKKDRPAFPDFYAWYHAQTADADAMVKDTQQRHGLKTELEAAGAA